MADVHRSSPSLLTDQDGVADEVLWREFAAAATPEAFYQVWLAIQCRLVPGVGSGVVVAAAPSTSRFVPAAFWPDGHRAAAHLAEAIERALAERRGVVLRRAGDPETQGKERYDVAYPIQTDDGKVSSVVALGIAPRPEPELKMVLRQLQWGAGWLEVLRHRIRASRLEPGSVEASRQRLQVVLDLVAGALGHERFYGAATSFVTTLANRLGCDRVSLGFLKGGRMRVRAVSHSADFGQQTNLVRAIGAAMDEALDQGATVTYPPRPEVARVTRAHAALERQHAAGAICTVLLAEGRRFVGGLTLERPVDRPFDPATIEFCEALAAVAGPVLEVQRRDDRWLVTKAAEASWRQLAHLIGPRHMVLKLSVIGLAALVAVLAFARGDYRVSARSVMEARSRLASVAPFNGYVKEAPTRAGDVVRQGQVLAVLDDRELRLERMKWQSQADQLVKQRDLAVAKRDAAAAQIASAQIDQARAQVALLDDQLSRTRLLAPLDGSVVTGDLSQSLGAPVERGQVLFEVAPLADYRLVLQVDERDIADVAGGQRGELLLTAWPADSVPFTVETITPVSTAREGRNYFRIEAKLDHIPDRLRPGMEGVGKIVAGRHLLVWIWTRQAIDWLRLKLWAWLP
jgi:Barrel-sandwich domain of CusB or HlyD membrane-fusion